MQFFNNLRSNRCNDFDTPVTSRVTPGPITDSDAAE